MAVATLNPAADAPRRVEFARFAMWTAVFVFVVFAALHQGSYSLVDRQILAIVVWGVLGVAAACGALPSGRLSRPTWFSLGAAVLLVAWTLLSLTWSDSAERTLAEFSRNLGYLGVLMLIWFGVDRRNWQAVAAALVAAGAFVAAMVVAARLVPGLFPPDTVLANLGATRANYPFGYWNAVGCWCAMAATLCLAFASDARTALVRAAALSVIPVFAAGLYLALSRAGFGGAVIGAAAVIVLSRWRWLALANAVIAGIASAVAIGVLREQKEIVDATGNSGAVTVVATLLLLGAALAVFAFAAERWDFGPKLKMSRARGRIAGAIGVLAIIAIAVVLAAQYGTKAYDQFTGRQVVAVELASSDRLAQLNGNRHNIWASAWSAFEQNPVAGIGPGTFEFWWSRFGVNREFVRDAHNLYLETLAELGLVGLLTLAALFLGVLWAAWITRRALVRDDSAGVGIHGGLVAVFLVFAFQSAVDWMWESTAVAVFALAAIALSCVAANPPRTSSSSASPSVGLSLVAILAVATLAVGVSGDRQMAKSQAAFREGNITAALEHANNAVEIQPWSASPRGQRALVLERQGRSSEALAEIAVAERKEPDNWRWPLAGTRIAVAAGDPDVAEQQLARVRELRPFLRMFGRESPSFR